jgi:hypothetical protein
MSKAKAIRTIHANETETVEIRWVLLDGSVHYERYTCPPAAVRHARQTAPAIPVTPISDPYRG